MRIGALVRQLWWLMRLPRVASFYLRALARALRTRDRWTIAVVTRPRELSDLVRLARGRRLIVEAGTASGWTAGALALAEPRSRVVTLDPEAHPQRDAYLGLLPEAARRRVELVAAAVEELGLRGEAHGTLFLWRKR